MSGNVQPIDVLMSENRRNNISENRKKLIPIVDTIITCARLGLSFRGHVVIPNIILKLEVIPVVVLGILSNY